MMNCVFLSLVLAVGVSFCMFVCEWLLGSLSFVEKFDLFFFGSVGIAFVFLSIVVGGGASFSMFVCELFLGLFSFVEKFGPFWYASDIGFQYCLWEFAYLGLFDLF